MGVFDKNGEPCSTPRPRKKEKVKPRLTRAPTSVTLRVHPCAIISTRGEGCLAFVDGKGKNRDPEGKHVDA